MKKNICYSLNLATAVFLIFFITSIQCRSVSNSEKIKLHKQPFLENNIVFFIPGNWKETKDHYFHFKAVGFAPNGLPASIKYRGLDFKTLDEKGKDLYATGWYEAIAKNYPEWQYESRKKIENDSEGSYEFEGTYKVATDTYRRIGKLRFRGKHIHAIYYMALDQDFESARSLFKTMDSKIQYNISK